MLSNIFNKVNRNFRFFFCTVWKLWIFVQVLLDEVSSKYSLMKLHSRILIIRNMFEDELFNKISSKDCLMEFHSRIIWWNFVQELFDDLFLVSYKTKLVWWKKCWIKLHPRKVWWNFIQVFFDEASFKNCLINYFWFFKNWSLFDDKIL